MFGKRVNAVIWNTPGRPDQRTNFVANYIFPDGFKTQKDCIDYVTEIGYNPYSFLYVKFCDNWYAIHLYEVSEKLIITTESVFAELMPQTRYQTSIIFPSNTFTSGDFKLISPQMVVFNTPGAEGLYRDIGMMDSNIELYDAEQMLVSSISDRVNVVAAFAKNFFINEICINTDPYVDHVFSAYFSPEAMSFIKDTIKSFRFDGIHYWNPFNGSVSGSSSEKTKKQKDLISSAGVDMGEIIETRFIDLLGRKHMNRTDLIGCGSLPENAIAFPANRIKR